MRGRGAGIGAAGGLLLCALAAPGAEAQGGTGATGDAIVGRWHTERRGGVVEIHRCGAALCGRVVDGAPLRANPDQRDVHNPDRSLRDRRVMGLRVLSGFTGGPSEWKGGPLYDPDSGDGAPKGTLRLVDRNTLQVKGCLALFLCRTQTWRRAR